MELIDIVTKRNTNGSRLIKSIPILTDQIMAATLLLEPHSEQPGHVHKNSDEIHYIIRGKGKITIDNDTQNIQAGMLVLVPRLKTHYFISGKDDLFVLSFTITGDINRK